MSEPFGYSEEIGSFVRDIGAEHDEAGQPLGTEMTSDEVLETLNAQDAENVRLREALEVIARANGDHPTRAWLIGFAAFSLGRQPSPVHFITYEPAAPVPSPLADHRNCHEIREKLEREIDAWKEEVARLRLVLKDVVALEDGACAYCRPGDPHVCYGHEKMAALARGVLSAVTEWQLPIPAPTLSPLAARFAALPEKVQEWEVKGERFADFDPEDPKECYCWSRAGCVITDGGLTTLPGLASNFLEAAELIAAHMAASREVAE
jgi:hypothetical protein